MLKELRIRNIVLVDSADIPFRKGMNVVSGETGSGKSAIMEAFALVLGARADTGLIRRDSPKGCVEALFDIQDNSKLKTLLEESGIDAEEEEMIIRREIHANGKNRAWINHQLVQVTLLRQVGEHLAEMINQHANQRLMSTEKHREIIDLYGDLIQERDKFSLSWKEENSIRREMEEMRQKEAERIRGQEICRMEIEELENAKLVEGEEEELFAEYTRLIHAEEMTQDLYQVDEAFNALSHLSEQKQKLQKLARIDPSLQESVASFSTNMLELHEIANTLRIYRGRIECNPARAEEINGRLSLIAKMKKKYGSTVSEIEEYLAARKQKLYDFEHFEEKIEELQEKLHHLTEQNSKLSHQLTMQRQKTATELEQNVVQELSALNMPKVEFEARFTKQNRSSHGEDHIEFFLRPNVGESMTSIRECASGGELSRLLLALQTVLTGKEQTPTLIFDEVDANIGGETATLVGQKLKRIGEKHQVLCITHFPQVAKQAAHHLQISKAEKDGRTITLIQELNEEEKSLEIKRMQGETCFVG